MVTQTPRKDAGSRAWRSDDENRLVYLVLHVVTFSMLFCRSARVTSFWFSGPIATRTSARAGSFIFPRNDAALLKKNGIRVRAHFPVISPVGSINPVNEDQRR